MQRRSTKLIPSLKNLPYEDRLRKLELPSLRYRRLRGDMIEVYKILNGVYDSRVTSGMLSVSGQSRTRGHTQKLNKYRSRIDIRKYFFTSRVVTIWNSLPEHVISAPSVNAFENRFDKFWTNHPLKYNPDMDIQFNPDIQLTLDTDSQFNPNKNNNINHSGAGSTETATIDYLTEEELNIEASGLRSEST